MNILVLLWIIVFVYAAIQLAAYREDCVGKSSGMQSGIALDREKQ